jgi:ketosteroid isomerase-like protein
MTKVLLSIATSVIVIPPVSAQTWTSAQQSVLDIVIESWDAIAARDVSWTDNFVHENAVVWSDQNPMPRTRAEEKEWDRFEFPSEDIVTHTISPAAIVVEGDTAIVHYYYSLGMENEEGERSVVHGRCSDILIADNASWKFISWNCGEEEDSDD